MNLKNLVTLLLLFERKSPIGARGGIQKLKAMEANTNSTNTLFEAQQFSLTAFNWISCWDQFKPLISIWSGHPLILCAVIKCYHNWKVIQSFFQPGKLNIKIISSVFFYLSFKISIHRLRNIINILIFFKIF